MHFLNWRNWIFFGFGLLLPLHRKSGRLCSSSKALLLSQSFLVGNDPSNFQEHEDLY